MALALVVHLECLLEKQLVFLMVNQSDFYTLYYHGQKLSIESRKTYFDGMCVCADDGLLEGDVDGALLGDKDGCADGDNDGDCEG